MDEKFFWIGLAAGLLPYRIERRRAGPRAWTLEIVALFWSLEIRRKPGKRGSWTIKVPLILRLRDAAWAAIMRIKGDGQDERD